MYLVEYKVGPKDHPNRYLKLCESYRENGKTRVRVIENFGRVDQLQPGKYEQLQEKYSRARQDKQQQIALDRMRTVSKSLACQASSNTSKGGPVPLLRYGHYPLKALWEKLRLHDKIAYEQRAGTGFRFDMNAAVSYMVFSKVMNPHSVRSTFEDKDLWLGDPAKGLSLDDLYHCYDFLAENKDGILKWINRKMDDAYGTKRATIVFYDVTNTYFETPLTDAEKGMTAPDFMDNVVTLAKKLRNEEQLPDSCFDDEGEPIIDSLPQDFWKLISDDKLEFLRMRGPSKEHRTDLPLVSIALVIDRNGFPMDFALYAGNASEFKTMRQSILSLKKKYTIANSIVVADRGLNSAANLTMLLDESDGFLVAQKVTQFSPSIQKLMFETDGYQLLDKSDPSKGRYRVIENWVKKGKRKSEDVTCTLVLTFNEKRQKRDQAILAAWVDIVKAKMEQGAKIGGHNTGWASLALTQGETEKKIIGIDEQLYQEKLALCGYAAIVYDQKSSRSQIDKGTGTVEPGLDAVQALSVYHRLGRIEDCFRILKSNVGLRPMFVYTKPRITGHMTACFLALLLIRMIQDQLEKQGVSLSAMQISATLNDCLVAPVKFAGSDALFLNVAREINFRGPDKRFTDNEVLKMINDGNLPLEAHHAEVMKACGLDSLPRLCTRFELARVIGTRFASEEDALPLAVRSVV